MNDLTKLLTKKEPVVKTAAEMRKTRQWNLIAESAETFLSYLFMAFEIPYYIDFLLAWRAHNAFDNLVTPNPNFVINFLL